MVRNRVPKKQDIGKVNGPLFPLALAMLMGSLGMSIANVALPRLSIDFAIPVQTIQWVVLGYLLAITVFVVGAGRLGDLLGQRKVFLSGIIVFLLGAVICSISKDFWLLIVGRVIQGIGAAALISLSMAFVRETVPDTKTGFAMGLLGAMSAVGTTLGPTVGGVLIGHYGWQSIFLVFIPLTAVNFILAVRYLPKSKIRPTKFSLSHFDVVGTLLLMVVLSCYTLSVTIGESMSQSNRFAMVLTSITCFALFVYVEKRSTNPLLDLTLFQNRKLTISLAMNILIATVMMSTLIVGPFYLIYALGLKEAIVGLVLSVGPFAAAVAGVPTGKIVDRIGAKRTLFIGLSVMLLASFSLAILPIYFGLLGYIISILFLTPGYQLFLSANNTEVMLNAENEQRGVVSGILNLSRNIGLITGASVMGAIFVYAADHKEVESASVAIIINAMKVTYLVAGTMVLTALVLSLFMPKPTDEKPNQ
ncbi:MFS transporter [Costertonia aggregata]|uniref:MFS transporter n=1 Tax=Costertonia aggregata TaxID=343403 RepID=A0A7H9AMZ2_9FLAO|nr:MFS transporter [Costertonia aggregata]QLG44743.1 MFS transporter [Costertonia aggregata]